MEVRGGPEDARSPFIFLSPLSGSRFLSWQRLRHADMASERGVHGTTSVASRAVLPACSSRACWCGGGGLRGLAAQVQASESRERDQDSLPSATKLLVEEQDKLQAPQEGELLSERVRSAVQTIKRRKLMFQQVSL